MAIYRLVLCGSTYRRINEKYETIEVEHVFNCDCVVQLLDLITDMVKTSDSTLKFEIARIEEEDD